MNVPAAVESGAVDSVILDCDYVLSARDLQQPIMDVRWYHRDEPFLQWIPGRQPQVIGDLFKGKIDLNYKVKNACFFVNRYFKKNAFFRLKARVS